MSDCDERTEIVGAACSFGPLFVWRFLLVANNWNIPMYSTIVQETMLTATFPPTSRTSKCRAPGCKPSPLVRNGRCHSRFDLQVIFGLSYGFLFLQRDRIFFCPVQGDTIVDNDRFGFSLLRSESSLCRISFVKVIESQFFSCRAPCGVSTLCVVPDLLGTLSRFY